MYSSLPAHSEYSPWVALLTLTVTGFPQTLKVPRGCLGLVSGWNVPLNFEPLQSTRQRPDFAIYFCPIQTVLEFQGRQPGFLLPRIRKISLHLLRLRCCAESCEQLWLGAQWPVRQQGGQGPAQAARTDGVTLAFGEAI